MSKTLADMTPAERAARVGMWCEYPNTRDRLGIIYDLDDDNDPWILRFDVRIEILGYDAKDTIPRFDMPRAWNPDGTPPAGEWEYDVLPEDDAANLTGKEVVDRRWTGEWEEASNA